MALEKHRRAIAPAQERRLARREDKDETLKVMLITLGPQETTEALPIVSELPRDSAHDSRARL